MLRNLAAGRAPTARSIVTVVNPCLDQVFQHGFRSTKVLAGFVNSILDLRGPQRIVTVEHVNRELPSVSTRSNQVRYNFTVDVRCRSERGEYILVQLQNDFRSHYYSKALMEYSRVIGNIGIELTGSGVASVTTEAWRKLKGVHTIILTNKPLTKRRKEYYRDEPVMEPELVNVYELRHEKHLERHYGDVPNKLVLVMLANLSELDVNKMTAAERWALVFKEDKATKGNVKLPPTKTIDDVALKQADAEDTCGVMEFVEWIDENKMSDADRAAMQRDYHNYEAAASGFQERTITAMIRRVGQRRPEMSRADIADMCGVTVEEVEEVLQDV